MNAKSVSSCGGRGAFLALLWLGAASAMGCTKCSPTDIFIKDAGTPEMDGGMDAGTDAAASACDSLPDPPDAGSAVPQPCRYWVVDLPASEATCAKIDVPTKPGMYWKASSAFDGKLSAAAMKTYCNYEWSDNASNPTKSDIALLPAVKSANCTYITPQQATPDPFTQWAHDELLPPLAERLPASGTPENVDVKVRVVVLDTAPSRPSTAPPSRHGRTLTELIRESACQKLGDCEVDVRSTLAMPRTMNAAGVPEITPTGGYFGLLSDLTNAVWKETNDYYQAIARVATRPEEVKKVPARVIFNESFGFGNTDAFPTRCSATAPLADDVTARSLFDALTAASCLGILHVAAAGNHTGGEKYREGLLCPARWDHAIIPDDAKCASVWGDSEWKFINEAFATFANQKTNGANSLALFPSASVRGRAVAAPKPVDSLLSVGGVDYNGMPIVLTRPDACPEAIAIGIGGTALGDTSEILPFLFGTSVSAAVASSRIAIKWTQALDNTAGEWQSLRGILPSTFARKGGVCATAPISCKDIPWIGKPATPIVGQNPDWPRLQPQTLWQPQGRQAQIAVESAVCIHKLPHCNRPSRAITADVWPQPVDPVCIKCGIFLPSGGTRSYPELWIEPNPNFFSAPRGAILVVEDPEGTMLLTQAIDYATLTSSSRTTLVGVDAAIFKDARVWLSGYDSEGNSYSQQIFVDK